jgi:hypothetical protein
VTAKPHDDSTAHATGSGTAHRNDVADPHPATEEHPYRKPKPPEDPRRDINRVNDAVHDGTPPPRPANVENGG